MRGAGFAFAAVLVAAAFAAGYLAGQRTGAGSPEPPPEALLPALASGEEGGPGFGQAAAEAPTGGAAADAAAVAVEMAFPGWQSRVVDHSDDWRAVTVRAASPDDAVALDLELEWDDATAGYVIVRASPAGASAAPSVSLPRGLMDALAANPTLGALKRPKITVERLTSTDALLLASSGAEKWRVYLRRASGGWVVKNARRLR